MRTMRRAFGVFRGYRRASEDDDEVFVRSPKHKVTSECVCGVFFSFMSPLPTDGFHLLPKFLADSASFVVFQTC